MNFITILQAGQAFTVRTKYQKILGYEILILGCFKIYKYKITATTDSGEELVLWDDDEAQIRIDPDLTMYGYEEFTKYSKAAFKETCAKHFYEKLKVRVNGDISEEEYYAVLFSDGTSRIGFSGGIKYIPVSNIDTIIERSLKIDYSKLMHIGKHYQSYISKTLNKSPKLNEFSAVMDIAMTRCNPYNPHSFGKLDSMIFIEKPNPIFDWYFNDKMKSINNTAPIIVIDYDLIFLITFLTGEEDSILLNHNNFLNMYYKCV